MELSYNKGYYSMKLDKFVVATLVMGALQFASLNTVSADEGAKTVTGEVLPASTDPDGDGWANVGFNPSGLPQSAIDKINQLTAEKIRVLCPK